MRFADKKSVRNRNREVQHKSYSVRTIIAFD